MTAERARSRTAAPLKPRTLVWLAVLGLACSLPGVPAAAPQQAAAQANAQPDKSQSDKAKSDKSQSDKAKQDAAAAKPAVPESSRRVYSVRNGNDVYYRSEEVDRKPTKDGEVETQRVREPGWSGDNRALQEKEVRTRNLPDGTVEKEYVTKNTNGADHLEPIEIVRERVKKSGDKTTIERETLTPDGEGHWNAIRKEQVNETGPDTARKSVKEVLEHDIMGRWQVVDRQVTSAKATKEGQESHAVRQLPDAYGRLSDYEVKDERTTSKGGKETHEVSLSRRDFQDTDHPKFLLVDKTVQEKTTSADGKQVTTHTTRQSDLNSGGASRDVRSYHAAPDEETTEVVTKGPNGEEKRVVDVKQRSVGDPNGVRPSYKVVQETDKDGNVRQVFIPSTDH
jgi:hypothetical protein